MQELRAPFRSVDYTGTAQRGHAATAILPHRRPDTAMRYEKLQETTLGDAASRGADQIIDGVQKRFCRLFTARERRPLRKNRHALCRGAARRRGCVLRGLGVNRFEPGLHRGLEGRMMQSETNAS